MCCCCPPAITALLCLWVRSGFSKASVAGALTFFPPQPPLYKFQRSTSDGQILEDDNDNDNDNDNDDDVENISSEESSEFENEDVDTPTTSSSSNSNTKKKKKSASATLSERSKKLRKRAKKRNARDARDAEMGVRYTLILDPRLCPASRFESGTVESIKLFNSKTKSYIAVVVYRQSEKNCKTILYSHGNATDIGAMNMMQCMLARGLNVNVVMYDYSGYGESSGMALEKNTYYDIDTVYDYTVQSVSEGVPENVIFYGQSVGSGPSCYICSRKTAGGLILHSPFTSGMRVLTPSRALACLDIFPNIDRIKKVKCPVMVIHGMQDEEVDMAHGLALHRAVAEELRREPWWVPDRGHNDICEGPGKMTEYIRRLRVFLDSLEEKSGEKEEKMDRL